MCAYLSDFLDSNLFQIIKCFVIERRKPGCIIGYSLRNIDYEALTCARQKNPIGICQIFDIVFEKNPLAVIVVTAVSLETLNGAVSAFKSHGILSPEIVQLAVTRTKNVGSHTMLSAENPVYIIKGAKH